MGKEWAELTKLADGRACTVTEYGETGLGSRAEEFSVSSECRTYGARIVIEPLSQPFRAGLCLDGRPSGPRRIIEVAHSFPHTW
jgi:hypothetical protein